MSRIPLNAHRPQAATTAEKSLAMTDIRPNANSPQAIAAPEGTATMTSIEFKANRPEAITAPKDAAAVLRITLNDTPFTLRRPLTLTALLAEHNLGAGGMALAVNHSIIPRQRWPDHQVQEGDSILLFQAIAGG